MVVPIKPAGTTMEQKLKKFVSNSLVHLVTDNKLDRMSWKKAFGQLEVRPEQVVFFESFEKALKAMEERPAKVLICAYEIKEQTADGLLESFRKHNPNLSEDLCLVVTESEDPRAELALLELELDGILRKPYNAQELDTQLKGVVRRKASLRPVERAFFKAMEYFNRGDLEPVRDYFEGAGPKPEKSSRFLTLRGHYLQSCGNLKNAISDYEEALTQELSYTAMSSLFDALLGENLHDEAFKIASDLIDKFDLHPKRISNYVKVCILTSNYHSFIQHAKNVYEKGVWDKNYAYQLAAGLAICAKSIGIADRKVAVDANLKALKLGREKSQIVDQALKNLLDLQEYELVNEIVSDLYEEEELKETVAVAEYRTLEAQGERPFQVFQKGMELTNRGIHDFHVYELLLKSAKQVGRKKESLEEIADNASKHYPEKSKYFRSLVA